MSLNILNVFMFSIGCIIGIFLTYVHMDYFSVMSFPGSWKSNPTESEINFYCKTKNFTRKEICSNYPNVNDSTMIDYHLPRRSRNLCWIMTCPEHLSTRAQAVKDTWGKRCDILLFASDIYNSTFPTINITVNHGRRYLYDKTRQAFNYIYKHHYDDADWYLKADDDTYVIIENLHHLLSDHDAAKALYFGSNFKSEEKEIKNTGYMTGGAGYVISREALRRYTMRSDICFISRLNEDIEWAKCMVLLGVTYGNSRDVLNRTRFHQLKPIDLMKENNKWYLKEIGGGQVGADGISDYAISFHYVVGYAEMRLLDYFVYHLRPYGVL